MHPELSGASALIAAGSRDSDVYLWRRRASLEEGGVTGRSSRAFPRTRMTGHKVSFVPLGVGVGSKWSIHMETRFFNKIGIPKGA